MIKIIILKGLPGSGKSTWARELMASNPSAYKRVNKDDIRAMVDDGRWSRKNEDFVLQIRDFIIITSALLGKHVIVDDTNLHPTHERDIRKLFNPDGATIVNGPTVKIEIQDFTNVTVEECIKRDLKRVNSVGSDVIRKMHKDFLADKQEPVEVEFIGGFPPCIIVDIDGTLAIKGDRSPYDWQKVGIDKVNFPVAELIGNIQLLDEHESHWIKTRIILVSGRDGECRDLTKDWLKQYNIKYDKLYLRRKGDKRKDVIVKKEIYERYIKGKYNVAFVLDDRNQTVAGWRALGLPCFQVNPGDF